jgi:hypothetical protein
MKNRTTLAALSGAFLLALAAGPAQAASYSAGLDFEADDRSMWSAAGAGVLDIHEFIGPTWNKSDTLGGTEDFGTPRITLVPEVCGWGICTPAVVIPAVDLGTFGAEISGSTKGAIGFDLDFDANTGAVDVAYPGTANFTYPDAGEILPGDATIAIQTAFSTGATELSTVFPFATLDLDFVFQVQAGGGLKVCVFDCASLNMPAINIDKTIDLIHIDTNTAATTFTVLDVITMSAQLPDSDMNALDTTPNAQGNLVAVGQDPADALFDIDIDVDLIATTLLGLPALTQEFTLLGASAGFTLLDVLIGAEVRLVQTFTFDPNLLVTLNASDGQSVTGAVGSNLLFNKFAGGETLVTPTFKLDNKFTNLTSLVITPTFDLEVLKAHLNINMPDIAGFNIPDVNLGFGPLFQCHIPGVCFDPNINLNVPIFNQSWTIPFDPVVGDAFIVKVPEPASLTLFGIGLALFGAGALRNRRRREQNQA